MHAPHPSRRQILLGAGAAGCAAMLPGRLNAWLDAGLPGADRRLVLLYLEGGNDGLNTLVPFADDRYHQARPRIGLKGELPRLDDLTALHPALLPWQALFEEGSLAVLRSVGYERPDRSHFISRDIWHSGAREPGTTPAGWVGRALDDQAGRLPAVALGADEAPLLLRGRVRSGLTLRRMEDFQLTVPEDVRDGRLAVLEAGAAGDSPLADRIGGLARDAYRTAEKLRTAVDKIPAGDKYPDHRLAERLRLAARLVRAEEGPPVLWTQLGGFDTHAVQPGIQASLLGQVAGATTAFIQDLQRDGSDQRTLVLVYSEFGRRVAENGSLGTDHGAAGPVFALGGVRGGLHGDPPELDDLDDGDLRAQTDFRSVFGAAGAWMGWDPATLFDRAAEPLAYTA